MLLGSVPPSPHASTNCSCVCSPLKQEPAAVSNTENRTFII
uniref:Uncharacterized protein n=1 Tax=Anguilla anguilla TaxID=7936 RepID=A0A0E9PHL9_ANGAN